MLYYLNNKICDISVDFVVKFYIPLHIAKLYTIVFVFICFWELLFYNFLMMYNIWFWDISFKLWYYCWLVFLLRLHYVTIYEARNCLKWSFLISLSSKWCTTYDWLHPSIWPAWKSILYNTDVISYNVSALIRSLK